MNEEKVKDLLREKGLKVTSQRLMVLNILSAHGDEHLTVEEIYDLAKEESPEIGLATIYRTVQVLLELHVIEKVTFDDGFARYELNGEETGSGHRHHHAICTQCGKCIPWRRIFWTLWKSRCSRVWALRLRTMR